MSQLYSDHSQNEMSKIETEIWIVHRMVYDFNYFSTTKSSAAGHGVFVFDTTEHGAKMWLSNYNLQSGNIWVGLSSK
jgi:hypothetical protein